MSRKALFVSIDGMTDQLGQAQVIPYLKRLSLEGFSIEICSCEKKTNFVKNKDIVSDILKEAGIEWNYCFYSSRLPVLSQRGNYRRLKAIVADRIMANNSKVFLHCRSYLPGLIGMAYKKTLKIPFVFDMRGFWADERIDGNIWKLSNPVQKKLYQYFKRKEKQMLLSADQVVTLTDNAKEEIISWKLKAKLSISVIPCCADTTHFTVQNEDKIENLKKELGIKKDAFVLGYLGALGTWYMLNEMLDFYSVLLQKNRNSVFMIVTNEPSAMVSEAAVLKGIPQENIRVIAGKRSEVPLLISCFDAGVFFIRPLYSKKGSSPTKLAEILACGIPVITNSGVGDMDAIMSQTNAGVIVDEFNEEVYRSVVTELFLLKNKKEFYRQIAEDYFSLEKGVESYKKIYSTLK